MASLRWVLQRDVAVGTAMLISAVLVAAIGVIDFATGTELRVFPLYMLPVSAAAWFGSRRGGALIGAASATAWLLSNHLAGLSYTQAWVWIANIILQGGMFVLLGVLIAEIRAAQRREQALSRTDALTALLNARAFWADAEIVLERCRRYGHAATLAYLDLDHFKRVNDTRGHAGGDEVLVQVATILRAGCRRVDVVARLGGDEFVLLLPETDRDGATVVLERLRADIAQALRTDGVTASIGGIAASVVVGDLAAIVRAADALMYEVKRDGKNRVRLGTVDDPGPPGTRATAVS